MCKGSNILILQVLLFFNILITCYLIFLISDFHKDVQSIKQSLEKSSEFVKDTWNIVGGSAVNKAYLIKKHGTNVKEWVLDKYKKLI